MFKKAEFKLEQVQKRATRMTRGMYKEKKLGLKHQEEMLLSKYS